MAPKQPTTGREACGDKCTCPAGGYCDRHAVPKSSHAVKLCRERSGYFTKYEQGRGLAQDRVRSASPKKVTKRVKVDTRGKLIKRDPEDLRFILEILCPGCSRYDRRRKICGRCRGRGQRVATKAQTGFCPTYRW